MPFKPKLFTNQGVGIEQTSVQTITQVKQRRAPSVLGWVTALEHWVLFIHSGTLGTTSKTGPGLFVPCLLSTIFHLSIFLYLFLVKQVKLNTSSALYDIFKY